MRRALTAPNTPVSPAPCGRKAPEKNGRRASGRKDPGAAPAPRGPSSGESAGKAFPRAGGGEGGEGGATPPPGRAPCVAAGPRAPSRSFQPASAAGTAGRPQTLAMRPLLLLAPLGWLLLAEAKGDAKPEGERAGRARGREAGLGCTGGLGFRGDPGSGRLATD